MAMTFLGNQGLRGIAELSARIAHHACEVLCRLPGIRRVFAAPFFQEFALELPLAAGEVYERLLARGVRGGLPLGRYFPERSRQMLFAATEMTAREDVDILEAQLREILQNAGLQNRTPAGDSGTRKGRLERAIP
jgi:glycine dehydrogenase subunit 1